MCVCFSSIPVSIFHQWNTGVSSLLDDAERQLWGSITDASTQLQHLQVCSKSTLNLCLVWQIKGPNGVFGSVYFMVLLGSKMTLISLKIMFLILNVNRFCFLRAPNIMHSSASHIHHNRTHSRVHTEIYKQHQK